MRSRSCATWAGVQQLAAEVEHDAGQLPAQGGGERRKHRVGRGAGETDREPPVLAARGAAGVLNRGIDRRQNLSAPLEQYLAGGRELDAARGAVQERLAELGLEAADLLGERRLRDVKPRGGSAEMPLLGDGDEVAQMPELHDSAWPIHI